MSIQLFSSYSHTHIHTYIHTLANEISIVHKVQPKCAPLVVSHKLTGDREEAYLHAYISITKFRTSNLQCIVFFCFFFFFQANAKLNHIIPMHPYQKRLAKEYQSISKANLPGVELISADELRSFLFKIHIDNHALYPDDYYLQVTITDQYPVDSPSVMFINYTSSPIPLHPHIYSNGHICLNLLGEDWTPACSIESILLSIQSMLHSNTLSERPPDDAQYTKSAPKDPKRTNFVYHDDNV